MKLKNILENLYEIKKQLEIEEKNNNPETESGYLKSIDYDISLNELYKATLSLEYILEKFNNI